MLLQYYPERHVLRYIHCQYILDKPEKPDLKSNDNACQQDHLRYLIQFAPLKTLVSVNPLLSQELVHFS